MFPINIDIIYFIIYKLFNFKHNKSSRYLYYFKTVQIYYFINIWGYTLNENIISLNMDLFYIKVQYFIPFLY